MNEATKALTLTRCGATFESTMQLKCYEEHFETIRETEGVDAALDQLVEWHLDPRSGPFAQHCHEVLHQLGVDEMASANGESGRISVFTGGRVTCTGGYVHGALTEYYRNYDRERLDASYTGLCAELVEAVSAEGGKDSDSTGWLSWNCNHMLGHALYTAYGDDLVAGASRCASFEADGDQRRGCEAGFFMEHFLVMGRTPGDGYARADSINDVHALCRAVDQQVARGCWSESGGMVYIMAGREWGPAGGACRDQAPGRAMLEACYESLGRNIAPYAGYEPPQMLEWCKQIGDQFAVETCITQVAGSQAMELDNVDAGVGLCVAGIVDAERLKRCTDGVRRTSDQIAGSGFDGGVGTWDR